MGDRSSPTDVGAVAASMASLLGSEDLADQISIVRELSRSYRAEVGAPIDELNGLAAAALRKLKGFEVPTPLERQALEQAIRMLRPILRVHNGDIPDLHASVAPRFRDWHRLQARGAMVARNVARVDGRRFGEAAMAEVATAFAVTDSLALTNAHVVDDLSLGVHELAAGMVELQFGAEFQMDRVAEASPVTEVIAIHPDLDIAMLRFEAGVGTHVTGLALSSEPAVELEPIVVVGFPQPDDRNPTFVSSAIPSNEPVFKRVAPGIVRETRRWGMVHDASTLGGNSGSPVLRLSDQTVIGVHNGGGYRSGNDAQGTAQARGFFEELGVPVP